MKLSEAIRLGAMLSPQNFFFGDVVSSCALEAACDALGIAREQWERLDEQFPEMQSSVQCPGCVRIDEAIDIAYHLNDSHEWTREQIADWVATIEAQAASTVPPMGESERSSPVSAGSASGVA